jgi:hypothetical protein
MLLAMPIQAKADVPPQPQAEFQTAEGSPAQIQTLAIAIYLLIALSVGTVSFLLILMLWGSRVRREARKPLPATKPNDPFWYLKAKRKALGEPKAHPDVSEGQSPSQTDPPTSG